MPAPVTPGGNLRQGLRTTLLGTYRRHIDGSETRRLLAMAMDLDQPSDARSEFYFYWESAPHIGRWAYGGELPFESFRGIQIEVTNHRWAKAIAWQADDAADDMSRDLVNQARSLGTSAATLDERVFFQIITGGTDTELLPSVPNAPDGSAFYLTTTRFGNSAGNASTAGTMNTTAGIRATYFLAVNNLIGYQDTKSQPLWGADVTGGPVLAIGNNAETEYILGAFARSELVESANNAGVSDEIRGSGRTVETWITQRATAATVYYFFANAPVKAVFSQLREDLAEAPANEANSDRARESDEHYIRFKMRKGFGVALPTTTFRVT